MKQIARPISFDDLHKLPEGTEFTACFTDTVKRNLQPVILKKRDARNWAERALDGIQILGTDQGGVPHAILKGTAVFSLTAHPAEQGSTEPERATGLCREQSRPELGWAIRRIANVTADSVTLNDGVSFCSPCFEGAAVGDTWAVFHEAGGACFGQVRQAVLLDPARPAVNPDWTAEELTVIQKLAAEKDMPPSQVLRQALRCYQESIEGYSLFCAEIPRILGQHDVSAYATEAFISAARRAFRLSPHPPVQP